MKLEAARRFALSLPETTEEPHFELWSFRVKGKIFATVPASGRLRIFIDEDEARAAVAADPSVFSEVRWGKRLCGVEVDLAAARVDVVRELLEDAWRRKAPKRLLAGIEANRSRRRV